MQRKTKIIIASIIGIIVIIPIILFILLVIFSSLSSSSRSVGYVSGSSMTQKSVASSSSADVSFNDRVSAQPEREMAAEENSGFPATAGETAAEVDQKIIKTGYLDLTVNTVDETVVKITALASGKGGYVQNSSVYEQEDGTKYGSIIIRIPASEFENTMSDSKKMAININTESAAGQDVTEQYTDLAARLKNAQAQEAEYLEILKKAVTVTDILSVQSYLGQVREQIETLQGSIKYLENMTSYSTITIYLSEEPTVKVPSKEFRPWTAVKEAAQALIFVAQALVITFIWLAILGGGILLPLIILLALLIWVVKRIWRRIYGKK